MVDTKLYTIAQIKEALQNFLEQDWVDSEYLDVFAKEYLANDFVEYLEKN